jgi:thioredoxin reductase (NADPH)
LSTVILDTLPEAGGQITAMYPEKVIFDVAGFPEIRGRDLVNNLVAQADSFTPTYWLGRTAQELATSDEGPVIVRDDQGDTITANAVIITGGLGTFTPRPLPAGDGWSDRGLVHFVPRLADHAGKDIIIAGGGDSAFDWAAELAPIARSVAVVHRRDKFRAHDASVDRVKALGVELITEAEIAELKDAEGGSTGAVASAVITKKDGTSREIPVQVVVAALGFTANLGPMTQWGLDIVGRHINVDTTMRTNLPRVFAAGDIVGYPGKVPLIAVGFGEAATAVNNAAVVIHPEAHVFPGHSSGEVA